MNKIKSKANKWKQTIFVTGNGRFFAAVRINGRSQFLGTFSKEMMHVNLLTLFSLQKI